MMNKKGLQFIQKILFIPSVIGVCFTLDVISKPSPVLFEVFLSAFFIISLVLFIGITVYLRIVYGIEDSVEFFGDIKPRGGHSGGR